MGTKKNPQNILKINVKRLYNKCFWDSGKSTKWSLKVNSQISSTHLDA